jgi:hypothetical protein
MIESLTKNLARIESNGFSFKAECVTIDDEDVKNANSEK